MKSEVQDRYGFSEQETCIRLGSLRTKTYTPRVRPYGKGIRVNEQLNSNEDLKDFVESGRGEGFK